MAKFTTPRLKRNVLSEELTRYCATRDRCQAIPKTHPSTCPVRVNVNMGQAISGSLQDPPWSRFLAEILISDG